MKSLADNRERVADLLQKLQGITLAHRIDGQDRTGSESFTTHSPIDGAALCQVSLGTEADIDAAAHAASAAFPGWRAVPAKERRQLLHEIADGIVARAEEIALLESVDTGQPIRFMAKAAIRGAENFRFFADRVGDAQNGLSLPTPTHLNYTSRSPIGPIGVITPWNTPFMLSTWKIAPALAAGCTVVHKPAEWSPLTARILIDVAESAGLPAGVWNMVNGYGETAGRALTEHPLIKAIGFVGESATGSAIMRQGSDSLKRVHFELGGKNPVVVFADADLERALDAVVFMIYSLNGERCTSSSRVLIEDSIYDEFVERIEQRVKQLQVGDPLDPATEVGPLIHARHLQKVESYFTVAREEGARVLVGGTPTQANDADLHAGGHWVQPTLFADATPAMRIAREEIFGPVLTAMRFSDETDAIAQANAVDYGLAGYVWTRDLGRALRVSDALEAGMIWVNSENVRHLPTPFGGTKASGIGRDGGDYSFDFYMETKNIALATGDHRIPGLGR